MVAALAVTSFASMPLAAATVAPSDPPQTPTVATPSTVASPTTVEPLVVNSDERPDGPFVEILEVSGWIDPVSAESIRRTVTNAAADGAQVVVIQLNSPGSLLSDDAMGELIQQLNAPGVIPVAVWVGPSGARVRGAAVDLLGAADIAGLASKVTLQPPGSAAMQTKAALGIDLADIEAPVLADFIGQLDGRTVDGRTLETAQDAVQTEDGTRANLRTVRFQQLGLLEQLLHNMSSPSIVYLMLMIGLALAVFEFYTGGVGIAATVAIVCGGLAAYGLGVLPTRPVAVGLILLAFVGFAIDVQAGQPRFWTGIAAVALAVGTRLLFRGGVSVPLWWAAIVIGMVIVFMVGGMPTMIRTRFATPTIGRESMIGSLGTAKTDVSPDGVVMVMGAPWRARTNRATPIVAGSQLRVASIDGLVLEVEPLEGAARDHRERRRDAAE
jgi:membrane-bound serine protease (ClpP class)